MTTKCPECGKALKVNDQFVGKRVKCPACQSLFVVGDGGAESDTKTPAVAKGERLSARGPRGAAASEAARPRRRARRAEEPEDEYEDEEDEDEYYTAEEATWGDILRDQWRRAPYWGIAVAAHVIFILIAMCITWAHPLYSEQQVVKFNLKKHPAQNLEMPDDDPFQVEPQKLQELNEQIFETTASESETTEELLVGAQLGTLDDTPLRMFARSSTGGGKAFAFDVGRRGRAGQAFEVSYHGIKGGGGNVVFVVDKSSSMLGPRMQRAQQELVKAVQKMFYRLKFNILFFEGGPFLHMTDKLVFATDAEKKKAKDFVEGVSPGGETNPIPALLQALKYADTDMIFLLSDGEFFVDDRDWKALVGECKKRKIVIHTIALEDSAGEDMLKKIASATGGQYKFVR